MTEYAQDIPHTEAIKGEIVTLYGENDQGVGVGYLVNNVVYKTTGSYWAIDARKDVNPMVRYERDMGTGYRNTVRKVLKLRI